ncbi:undecaprenyldiphospho-muramoylpentapeptide beta-N-acetylglucosaminyltransferase [Pontibacillus yanchengensis]|uniref:UDP-N-acetylglucosamine--N-acetylmuramyl-(pentapeptide) pyrophosphoryl-undecaprenol N-acetylglucosamine transferase n=1 Tax=Pontibacillus yanchengensis Y32 TaxID=1385514 RepID=A0A0A2T796_9BACI|nr:undecaprenyldiphospho-muramoylpentapeptide beta-N-acetylglucosaminyltransferase [Pontibacillus yanchengensis]KGP71344.1 UDP-diphospho-muramoylpentapeptide beta-N- acetylglucosaminyltransferase [Pontibacillus yanchengensis Y32]
MTSKRILFTGGGTAGHVIVNLALIPAFQKDGWEIDYIGSEKGIEKKLISNLEGVTYHSIATGKLRRYFSKENFKDPFRVLKGTGQAYNIIRKRKPQVVFSKGGFVSVPVVAAAKLNRVPAVIHESDYTPGLANKLAMRFAKKVLTTFPETNQYLPESKAEWIGAVVRDELFQGSRQKGLSMTNFTKSKPIILVMGGSSGSKNINNAIRNNLSKLLEQFQVVHLCGEGNKDESLEKPGYVQYEYVNEELNDLFAITDYVVSRAGSNSIFEFLALKKPMLLIPLSRHASRGDQILNANSFVKQGYARMVEEEELDSERLLEELQQLQQQKDQILSNMENYKSEQAKDKIIKTIKEA